MKYKIVKGDSYVTVMAEINELINNGWDLLGGIAISSYDYSIGVEKHVGCYYAQALIKR